ncbi:MAG: polysaccharide pyruvyl transferase family protein, partial [Chlorobi bacterium]|nr:polysaccharide pyruvyl transferase family protein [Chlorobiota bacterium]
DIRAANEAAAMSSVRDQATSEFLTEQGVTKHIITGCPAMYLFDNKFELKDSNYCLLTFPFPVIRDSNREMFNNLTIIIKEVIKYLKSKGLKSIISCHDDRDVARAQEIFPEEQLFFSNYPEDYYDLYDNAVAVIGTRLHATILASGLGTPFININLDLRGKSFSETFGLENHNIDSNDPELMPKLFSGIDSILDNNLTALTDFYKVKSGYRNVFDKFMDGVAADIYKKTDRSSRQK